jgi:hypothetical protein
VPTAAPTNDPARRVYLTPGVYRQPQPLPAAGVRLVRTDVAGFVGYAERGPLANDLAHPGKDDAPYDPARPEELAVRITSWKQFLATFGGFLENGCLAYAVRGFFANGGTTCYVVRVAGADASDQTKRPLTARVRLSGWVRVALVSGAVAAKHATVRVCDLGQLAPGEAIQDKDQVMLVGGGAPAELLRVARRRGDKLAFAFDRLPGFNREPREGDPIFLAKESRSSPRPSPVRSPVTAHAASAGPWGDRLRLTVMPLPGPDPDFALRVWVEGQSDPSLPREEEYYNHLSLDEDSPFYAIPRVNNFSNLVRLTIDDRAVRLSDGPAGPPLADERGGDGLGLASVADFTGEDANGTELPYRRGLRLLEAIDEVAILCVPDAVFVPPAAVPPPPPRPADPCSPPPKPPKPAKSSGPPSLDAGTIYRAMLSQCERLRDRVAILDPPLLPQPAPPQYKGAQEPPTPWQEATLRWRKDFTHRFAATYYPWLLVPDPLGVDGPARAVPPSGYVAGVYAATDNQFGVQRPPANVELQLVTDVAETVTALQQEALNYAGVNAIRPFPNRGVRVWGARSLADPVRDPDWRFIHVRRLMSMIEQSVDYSTRWAVFESNTEDLRRTLAHSLAVFLEGVWRRGGLKGAVPAEGFYVKCDATNNPQAVIDAGQVVCEVGVAPVAPMEFLVFAVRQKVDGADVAEQ